MQERSMFYPVFIFMTILMFGCFVGHGGVLGLKRVGDLEGDDGFTGAFLIPESFFILICFGAGVLFKNPMVKDYLFTASKCILCIMIFSYLVTPALVFIATEIPGIKDILSHFRQKKDIK